MTAFSMWFAFAFVLIALLLSVWQKLGLEKEIAIGTVRSTVQLLAIGYVLQFVFQSDHIGFILILIVMMVSVASWNAASRGAGLPGIFWRIAIALSVTELVTMGLLVLLGLVSPTPQYLIPMSGMIIGSSMVVCGLYLNHMNRETESSRGEIEALLSLGATPRQAIQGVLKRAVKASMIPTFDTMKTIGLVQLPGMMTGMIVAGASPIDAVRYQILIMLTFSSSAAISAVLISLISYRLWFTKESILRS
ncbi:ABC transporter permease [Brevibacillus brevis]|uniref:Iron export ABC transporter permease subunit FetB n=1 Tax=Brevibacillus brevis TaxID=1393 RepID=A0ABY9T2X7_BREBE|nr:iron export ABC transporter permease subunit FetB [Brevibacillus brevis]WNC14366.1 iron export ABC transporter permease subunit FetB [Brevibacillus brevis]